MARKKKKEEIQTQEDKATQVTKVRGEYSGLANSADPHWHFDIYSLLIGPQELYFGHEVQVNVNIVETVKIATDSGEIEKCYISPTKRRGVERRTLLWAPAKDTSKGPLLTDSLECGIPLTCMEDNCPICRIFGGLETGEKTFIGRYIHAGGVAIQPQLPEEKQRAMHPSQMNNNPRENSPQPFKREYNEPGLLYSISNHAFSVTEKEFSAAAYAFINSLIRLGAGNPKGLWFYEESDFLDNTRQPLFVVDKYWVPKGRRPVVPPYIDKIKEAEGIFKTNAQIVNGGQVQNGVATAQYFTRYLGQKALEQLQEWADTFAKEYLDQAST